MKNELEENEKEKLEKELLLISNQNQEYLIQIK